MRNKIFFLFLLSSYLFTGCFFINNSGNTPSTDDQPETDVYSYDLYNNSDYTIDVYYDSAREKQDKVISVAAKSKQTIKVNKSFVNDLNELVLYYVYHFDFGADFPWYDSSSFSVIPFYRNTSVANVNNPQKNESKKSFIIIENKSENTFYFMQGTSGELGSIDSQKSKGFVISELNRDNLSRYTIKSFDGKQSISLDDVIPESKLKSGTIYTILITKDENHENIAVLKSITPFNLDTQKKIWAFDNQTFSSVYSICMRPSLDKKSTYVMGTRVDDETTIGYIKINEYGKYTEENNNFFSYQYDEKSEDIILETEVIDFIEQTDNAGNSVLVSLSRLVSTPKSNLVNGELRDDDDLKEFYIISSYDCKNYSLKWKTQIKSVLFRNDSKNKICAIGKDKIAITGAYLDDDYQIHYCLIYVDGSQNDVKVVPVISTESNDFENSNERMLTSAYFYNNNLYFCGYENWKSDDYSTTHLGKVWKIALEDLLNEDNSIFTNDDKVIYSTENSLFFSIEGNNSDFVVCGEYTDNGKILKGCFVTKKMIESDDSIGKKPVLYVENERSYCWCNQVCMYDDKIVLCGKAANSFNGSKNPVSFVVAYDNNQKKLWNVTYDYPDALNIIPNTIGTFLLQLRGQNDTIHYVNADLLGNEKH